MSRLRLSTSGFVPNSLGSHFNCLRLYFQAERRKTSRKESYRRSWKNFRKCVFINYGLGMYFQGFCAVGLVFLIDLAIGKHGELSEAHKIHENIDTFGLFTDALSSLSFCFNLPRNRMNLESSDRYLRI